MPENEQPAPAPAPLGLAAFESLRAEEEPWLVPHAFVPPPDFELMAGARSIVVYGSPGSGKTALSRMLEYRAQSAHPRRLVTRWKPTLALEQRSPLANQRRALLDQTMQSCAVALVEHLTTTPDAYAQSPDWAQRTLTWFVKQYAKDDLTFRATQLMGQASSTVQSLLREFLSPISDSPFKGNSTLDTIVSRFSQSLSTLGFDGLWVMADGVEGLAETNPVELAEVLNSFLSTLAYFEQSPLFFKLTLPDSLQPRLANSGSLVRRRVFQYKLTWPDHLLRQIVERRIGVMLGQRDWTVNDLYTPSAKKKRSAKADGESQTSNPRTHPIQAWIADHGGYTPHGWLDSATRLAQAYVELQSPGEIRPLTRQEWVEARKRLPLALDLTQTGVVKIGQRAIDRLPPLKMSVLRYLLAHEGELCPKEDLYSKAYLAPGAPSQLGQNKKGGEIISTTQSGYADTVDTVIWRLREAIEPDLDDPVFIITHKGQGITLYTQPFQKTSW